MFAVKIIVLQGAKVCATREVVIRRIEQEEEGI